MLNKKLSVIIPCYNEQESIIPMYERLIKAIKDVVSNYEFIFIDNASTDNSESIFRSLSSKDKNVKIIFMSRNLGSSQPSYCAGLNYCTGDFAVLIDGDIQDPPELIPDMIKKWEEDYQVVYGVRTKRKGSLMRRLGYKLFYRIFRKLSYLDIPLDAGDFSLLDRKVVETMKEFNEIDYYVRGIRTWAGFKQIGIEYTRDERSRGMSSLTILDNFKWAKKAILNFSYKPLVLISQLALAMVLTSFLAILIYVVLYIFADEVPRGITTIIVLILFLGGIQLLALSIIGEYIGKIFEEVKQRPKYVIKEKINFEENENII